MQPPNKTCSGRDAEGCIRGCFPDIFLHEQVGRRRIGKSRNGAYNAL